MEAIQQFQLDPAAQAQLPDLGPEQGVALGTENYSYEMPANGGEDPGEPAAAGDGDDKPLSSRYRGVCWNKKNRRWQAAINSSGKYVYLGSYIGEDEAAKAFDRAAIRLRGSRAKLNFNYNDYIDDNGNMIEDQRLQSVMTKVDATINAQAGKVGGSGGGRGSSGGADEMPFGANDRSRLHRAMGFGNGGINEWGASKFGGAAKPGAALPKDLHLPMGCVLDSMVSGEGDVYGVCYKDALGGPGSAVWDGMVLIDLGVFDTEKDARQACSGCIRVVLRYRENNPAALLQGLHEGGAGAPNNTADHAVLSQLLNGSSAAMGRSMYGLLLGTDGAGVQSVAPGAEAGRVENHGQLPLMQLSHGTGAAPAGANSSKSQSPSYMELFSWLSAYQERSKGVSGAGGAGSEEANGAAPGVLPSIPSAPDGSLSEEAAAMLRGQLGGAPGGDISGLKRTAPDSGAAPEDVQGAGKRLNVSTDFAHVQKLSAVRLQDALKGLFEVPGQGGGAAGAAGTGQA